jgi:hypothetical protein
LREEAAHGTLTARRSLGELLCKDLHDMRAFVHTVQHYDRSWWRTAVVGFAGTVELLQVPLGEQKQPLSAAEFPVGTSTGVYTNQAHSVSCSTAHDMIAEYLWLDHLGTIAVDVDSQRTS